MVNTLYTELQLARYVENEQRLQELEAGEVGSIREVVAETRRLVAEQERIKYALSSAPSYPYFAWGPGITLSQTGGTTQGEPL